MDARTMVMPAPRWLTARLPDELLVELELLALVPFSCLARDKNASKLLGLVSTAFTENTMPDPQWLACAQ